MLLLAALGCSCPSLSQLGKSTEGPPPRSTPSNAFANSTDTTKTAKKGEYDLTTAKFDRLKVGMARSEVESILGGPGTQISNTTGGGVRFSVNKWQGDDFKSIILSFKNDKIMTKSQVGLN